VFNFFPLTLHNITHIKLKEMKSKTFRVLVVLMAILLIGGMMASCKKETIKPEKVENKMIGQWDHVDDTDATVPQNYQNDIVNITLNEGKSTNHDYDTGTVTNSFEYRVEDGMFYTTYYNTITDELQSNENSGKPIYMTHNDTLVIGNRLYCRL
jgi:hypothetical protein